MGTAIQWILRILVILVSSTILSNANAETLGELAPGYHKGLSIKVDGTKRTFNLSIPFYNKKKISRIPAMIALHGGGGKNGDEFYSAKNFLPEAHVNAKKFTNQPILLVYPDSWVNGSHRQWNDHRPETEDGIDDVKFIKKLKKKIVEELSVDDSKVIVSGVSNGGLLTYRIMCENQYQFAGFAPVIANIPMGLLKSRYLNSCSSPQRFVTTNYSCKALEQRALKRPMILMFGTEDTIMPFDGGCTATDEDQGAGGLVSSAEETFNTIHDIGRCNDKHSSYRNLDSVDDSTTPHYLEYQCKQASKVGLVYIEGAGHVPANTINSDIPRVPSFIRPSRDFNSPDLILEFFGL